MPQKSGKYVFSSRFYEVISNVFTQREARKQQVIQQLTVKVHSEKVKARKVVNVDTESDP